MSALLRRTIGNYHWMLENEEKIKAMLPTTWTHISNINRLKLGFKLKLIGVSWRTPEELANVIVYFERIGMLVRQNGNQVMASPLQVMMKWDGYGNER